MPTARVAKMINLGHSQKLMISKLEERITFAARLKFEPKDVFVKRLCLCQIVNLDRHVITAVDLYAHTPALCKLTGHYGQRINPHFTHGQEQRHDSRNGFSCRDKE